MQVLEVRNAEFIESLTKQARSGTEHWGRWANDPRRRAGSRQAGGPARPVIQEGTPEAGPWGTERLTMTTYPINYLRIPNGFPKPEGLVHLESASAQPRIPAKVEAEQMSEHANVAAPATAGDIMRPPLTTVEPNDHVAAAAYLMKHAGATALMILNPQTGQPAGIITEADIAHAVADGKDVNNTRIYELMTTRPTVINTTTSVRDAAEVMMSGHFRHLPVVGDAGLVGIVDITDVCRALLEPDVSQSATGPR